MKQALLAYAAGFIDGEGCILVENDTRITVSVSQLDTRPLEFLKAHHGGSVCTSGASKGRANRPYKWKIYGDPAKRFLYQIRPFLLLKAEEADLAMDFPMMGKGRKALPEVQLKRKRIAVALKKIKRERNN